LSRSGGRVIENAAALLLGMQHGSGLQCTGWAAGWAAGWI